MTVRLEFEPRDLWVGAYWEVTPGDPANSLVMRRVGSGMPVMTIYPQRATVDLWVCVLPMLPLHFQWRL